MNLNQISIPSLDLSKSVPFYEKLGLKLMVKSFSDYARFECPDGGATFSLHRVATLPKGDGICIYFECNDIETYVDELISKGISFEELPEDKKWLWFEARLKDVVGNQIILYYAGKTGVFPPWRLDS